VATRGELPLVLTPRLNWGWESYSGLRRLNANSFGFAIQEIDPLLSRSSDGLRVKIQSGGVRLVHPSVVCGCDVFVEKDWQLGLKNRRQGNQVSMASHRV
jgi:hypothetical protein